MRSWKIVILKALLFYGITFLLQFLNVLIFFLTFGSGAEASRISEIW